ncbi:MAG: DUF211 domain-containing protein [Thermoplasmata archaeon]
MGQIKRLVLDVLKPLNPTILSLAETLTTAKGINSVTCTIEEVDRETETVKVIIEGNDVIFASVEKIITDSGSVIRSIDSVTIGKKHGEEKIGR